MHRLVLVGGGHAHLGVLRALEKHRLDIDIVLITPRLHQMYSGMLPGWMAGHYKLSDCQIELSLLARAAGVRMIMSHVIGVNAEQRSVMLADGVQVDYDYLSLDVGSESKLSGLQALGELLLPVRPIDAFIQRWPDILAQAVKQDDFQLAVVGGGAAGVEIAFAAQHVLAGCASSATVSLIASEKGILGGHSPCVIKRARDLLIARGVKLYEAHGVGVEHGIMLGNGRFLHADIVIAAMGSSSPSWLESSQLALDENGYIIVDATHRSISHANVFAAGDVCARTDTGMARSGVHAVFSGLVLAHNLIASVSGGKYIQYRPRKRSLYLLATGPQHAIASWGAFSAQGHWVWRWKNWIDRRFIHQNTRASVVKD